MTPWRLDPVFETAANMDVLAFLRAKNPSAHSDVADALTRSASEIPTLRHACPDTARYAFVVLHRSDFEIVGLAWGQSTLAFRLPPTHVDDALADGGTRAVELGPAWVRFEPWSNDETLAVSRERLARWCAVAAG